MSAMKSSEAGSSLPELLVDQRRRWQCGERPRVEEYLALQPAFSGDSEATLDLIYNEVLLREQLGQQPGLEEYLARFPQLAEALRIQFALDDALQTWQPLESESDLFAAGGQAAWSWAAASHLGGEAPAESLPAVAGHQILGVLGRGGMGVVYKARDIRLGRLVALKFLLPDRYLDEAMLRRFENEIRTASALNHPNICTIYQIGSHHGQPFIAMEYIAGRTLRALGSLQPCAETAGQVCRVPCPLPTCPFSLPNAPPPRSPSGLAPVPLADLLPVVRQVARALAAAHAAGIVHRDIKPENIMVRDDGYAKVLDFGLSRLIAAEHDEEQGPERLIGTLPYMSPEQLRGAGGTAASDIYALGRMVYELLTGVLPCADSAADLPALPANQLRSAQFAHGDLPPALAALLDRMLAPTPGLRPSARDVEQALLSLGPPDRLE